MSPAPELALALALALVSALQAALNPAPLSRILLAGVSHVSTPGKHIDTPNELRHLLEHTRRIAVIGIKPDRAQPANYVPDYAMRAGYEIVPVPVYYPDLTEMLGEKIYRSLMDIPGDVDMVNVFRRSNDVPKHLDDILAKRPKSVWMQLGIRNDEVANALVAAGIDVVQDRCLLVELRAIGR